MWRAGYAGGKSVRMPRLSAYCRGEPGLDGRRTRRAKSASAPPGRGGTRDSLFFRKLSAPVSDRVLVRPLTVLSTGSLTLRSKDRSAEYRDRAHPARGGGGKGQVRAVMNMLTKSEKAVCQCCIFSERTPSLRKKKWQRAREHPQKIPFLFRRR